MAGGAYAGGCFVLCRMRYVGRNDGAQLSQEQAAGLIREILPAGRSFPGNDGNTTVNVIWRRNNGRNADCIWFAGRNVSIYLRHEYDERMPAIGCRGENEKHPGDADAESLAGGAGRCADHGGAAEQQCHHGYGYRLRQRRADEPASGDFDYPGCQYRYDYDSPDYRL